MQQKGLHRLRLVYQRLFDQVIDERALTAPGVGEKLLHLGLGAPPLQGEGGQLQPGDPALRPAQDGGEGGGLQLPFQRHVQKVARLGGIELEVGGTQLAEQPLRPQPRERQEGIGARGEDQVEVGRAVLHEKGHGVLNMTLALRDTIRSARSRIARSL